MSRLTPPILRLRPALLTLVAAFALGACDSSETIETPSPELVLYVGNQGNFSDNNGSITRYAPETGTAEQDAVPDLGGLVQALVTGGGQVYVLLNFDDSFSTGRGRIDVIDVTSGDRVRQIDVETPRALAALVTLSGGLPVEVYATNLYASTITPVNLFSGETGDPIEVGTFPEGAVTVAGRTYVANSGFGSGTTLSSIDQTGLTGTVEDVCPGPRTVLADRELDVWVICTGASDFETGEVTAPGQVVILDGETGEVRDRFTYEGETLGSATLGEDGVFVADSNGDKVFVIAPGGVLRFDAVTNTLDERIAVPGAPIGAVAYDPNADRIYLGRPDADAPFSADGVVTIHDDAGVEVGRFGAGIAPSTFAFGISDRSDDS